MINGAFADTNPFFGKYENQMTINIGAGINGGFLIPSPTQFVPYAMVHFQYSQPAEFFKMPARKSLNIAQNIGWGKKYNWTWNDYSIPMVFLSEDVALLSNKNWYFGSGVGIGLQLKQNERVSSKFLLGFKIFIGHNINELISTEIFMQHFSNGNTTIENYSYGFYGMGITYKF